MGIDLARYPSSDPMFSVVRLLAHFGIDCVVDVGANSGGFASTIRSLGYSGRIVSLEPLSGPFELLAARAAKSLVSRAQTRRFMAPHSLLPPSHLVPRKTFW